MRSLGVVHDDLEVSCQPRPKPLQGQVVLPGLCELLEPRCPWPLLAIATEGTWLGVARAAGAWVSAGTIL